MNSVPLDNPNPYAVGDICHTAFEKCLVLEQEYGMSTTLHPMTAARFLGHLLRQLGGEQAARFASDIVSCVNRETTIELAKFLIDRFIRTFKSAKGCTPQPSNHPSRPSFDATQAEIIALLVKPSKSYAESRNLAFSRDGFRCVLTKLFDAHSTQNFASVQAVSIHQGRPIYAHLAHIIPQSINANVSDEAKGKWAGSVLAVLSRFGCDTLPAELNGDGIHRLENVMVMEPTLHAAFDDLQVWFEATQIPNVYNIKTTISNLLLEVSNPVTLANYASPALAPLPSPQYLALHAACAKVANLSGAGEYVDKILHNMECTDVLAMDGSSTDILQFALSQISVY